MPNNANTRPATNDINATPAASFPIGITPEQAQARAQHLLRCLARDARLASDRAQLGSCPVAEMNAAVDACKTALEAVRIWSQSLPGGR